MVLFVFALDVYFSFLHSYFVCIYVGDGIRLYVCVYVCSLLVSLTSKKISKDVGCVNKRERLSASSYIF